MVCLDMKTILILRSILYYDAEVDWSRYTSIPIIILQEMEQSGTEEFPYEGDNPEYNYIRMYKTLMIHRLINKMNCENASLKAIKIMSEHCFELLTRDDVILF